MHRNTDCGCWISPMTLCCISLFRHLFIFEQMPVADYAEHPWFSMASHRMWNLLRYRYVLEQAKLTNTNINMAARTEAMRYTVRVIRCRIVPSALNAMQVPDSRLHTLECYNNGENVDPFHMTAALCLSGCTLRTLIVHSDRAIRCFARQFVHLTRLSSLTASVAGNDIHPVLSGLTTLKGLSHLDLNLNGAMADMDPTIITAGLTHANLRFLRLRITIQCDAHCNHMMDMVGQLRLPLLRGLQVTFDCAQSSEFQFHRLAPLFGTQATLLSDFTIDFFGPRSGMQTLDALLPIILRSHGIRAVRFGAHAARSFIPPDMPPRGIRCLVVPAHALGACLRDDAPTTMERLSDLTSLQLHVGNTTEMDHLHTIMVALLPQLQTLVINGGTTYAHCECPHTVTLFDAILKADKQQDHRPLLHASVKVTTVPDSDVLFRGLESLAVRGLRKLDLWLTGSLGPEGTQRLMYALSAASATLETMCLSGALVLYDVLLSAETSALLGRPFCRVHNLDIVLSMDSVKPLPDDGALAQLRFPNGLKQFSLGSSALSCVADFHSMCAVTQTLSASAASIASVDITDIQWLDVKESLSHFGAHLGRTFEKLTKVHLWIHSLHSRNTLAFICGGLARSPNIENLDIAFSNTNVHAVVGRLLSTMESLVTLTLTVADGTLILHGADDALAMLAQIPTLSVLTVYDDRDPTGPDNGAGLGALDAALRSRRLLRYRQILDYSASM